MDQESPLKGSTSRLATILVLFLVVFLALTQWDEDLHSVRTLKYDQFLQLISRRQLRQVVLGSEWIEGQALRIPLQEFHSFRTPRLEDPSLLSRLENAEIDFQGSQAGAHRDLYRVVAWVLVVGLILSFWVFMLRRLGSPLQSSGLMQLSRTKARVYSELSPQVRFADVAGADEA